MTNLKLTKKLGPCSTSRSQLNSEPRLIPSFAGFWHWFLLAGALSFCCSGPVQFQGQGASALVRYKDLATGDTYCQHGMVFGEDGVTPTDCAEVPNSAASPEDMQKYRPEAHLSTQCMEGPCLQRTDPMMSCIGGGGTFFPVGRRDMWGWLIEPFERPHLA